MQNKRIDVLAIKEYEQEQNGATVKKTQWNRIGRAWITKSMESVGFELFMFPGQRFLIQFADRRQEQNKTQNQNEGGF